uniref:putative F-box only protein 10 isoform X1 n=1 Tax=Erigeron canadensis TaxID=72917 RepID=UPI001CB8B688|nr:putative F-box only protein 10 isoform X1 [Erigeron canadensis]
MSDHIPFEIQQKIMKKLPVKSLLQFRTVSKEWKSLIDSADFILGYNNEQQQQHHHILVRYDDSQIPGEEQFVSIIDDHTFPQCKSSPTVPIPLKLLKCTIIVGCSRGLFCLYNFYSDYAKKMAVIWNPAIRKSVAIAVPNILDPPNVTVIGFGVCPNTSDLKLVKFAYVFDSLDLNFENPSWQADVFTLSSGEWRRLVLNLPSNSIMAVTQNQVDVNGFIYWRYIGKISEDEVDMIMSVDMAGEEVTQVCLPATLALKTDINLSISKLRECLVVLECNTKAEKRVYGVWMMMEHGVPESFTKLYTINIPDASIRNVLGFRKSGEALIELVNLDDTDQDPIVVYDPSSGHISNIGISGVGYSCFASSYMESLLLLDQ